ncbi:MAG: UbiD family decarboxylase [Chloroflexi bacterium]|nr:UbiD family decarboxylase [Chloroflexota bacterium]
MPYQDLREFLARMEQEGEVSHINVEVDLQYEVGAICSRNYDLGGLDKSKVLVFDKPKGYDIPLVVNVIGTRKRYAMAIDTTPDKFTDEWIKRTKNPLKPVIVEHGPCKENIHLGDDVDLYELPIPTWNDKDGGPYITLPHHISRDPETGKGNMGIYRSQVHDKKTLGIWAEPFRHINIQWRKALSKGKNFPVAIAIGVEPTITICANANCPFGVDELEVAGGLRGQPVEMVKCETVPLEAPASAEWVLEGEVRPNERRLEGPFGEGGGYYGEQAELEYVNITAITHRNNPVHQAAYLRRPPSEVLSLKICWEAEAARQFPLPGLLKLNFPEGGCTGAIAIASIKKQFDGQGKMAGMGLLGTQAGRVVKVAIIVDEDIDPFNLTDVLWAISTRFQPDRDLEIIRDVSSWALDPSIPLESRMKATHLTSKMIIDATRPIKEPFAEVISPHKDMIAKVTREWSKYGITY